MLVLSRKLNEKIVLPTLGTTIQVLAIKRGVVRLGIDAPPEIPIRRAEVPDQTAEWGREEANAEAPTAIPGCLDRFICQVRDRLRTGSAGLGLLRLYLDGGWTDDARTTLAALHRDLQLLLRGVEGEAENLSSRSTHAAKRHKALLVEDDRMECELLAGYLRQSGLEVDTAGDGANALDYLRARDKPDVVLLDMGLPRVDGPTIVREIRRNPALAGLKIFGVSGHCADEFDLDRGPMGVDRWFQKPFDPEILLHDLVEAGLVVEPAHFPV
jgi:carbon storage regulator CsrA